jgi:putative nucleotidyltransferase with HDIG domain
MSATMLRRVSRDDVRLGMFIRSFEGSWLQHPFWRRNFVLENPSDLAKLLASDVVGVLIDDEKGVAPDPGPSFALPAALPPSRPIARVAPQPVPVRAHSLALPPECSAAEEYSRASQTVRKARKAVMKMFGEARLGRAISTAGIAPLVDEIAQSVARSPAALIGIARLKSKDEYTYMHSVAVCALMINLARHIGLDESLIRDVGMAGLLHDIGKMAMPDGVLTKAGGLTDDEYAIVRGHPERGHELLVNSPDVPAIALDVCLHHHEKMDGTGYPHGLTGDAISLHARMGAICDVYDAITSNRPYKDAWTPTDSLARMLEWEGHFDTDLLDRFVRSVGIFPIGMLVRLRSNRLAVVVAENKADPTLPRVRAFYSIMDRAIVEPEELTVSANLRGDQIVGREMPERWGLAANWDALSARIVAGAPLGELMQAP